MRIIGINNEMYISSACLIEDGEVIAAGAEERFTRQKLTRAFPQKAIEYCLSSGGIRMSDVDYLATSWNPALYFTKYNPLYSGQRRHHVEQAYSVMDNILHFYGRGKADHFYQEAGGEFGKARVWHITHHRAHAANGFFLSPFETAAILTADAQGEFESTTFCHGRGNQIMHIGSIDYPHSLGGLYSTFTEYLGFKPNSDEWKVMAMASYADHNNRYYRSFRESVVRLLEDGRFELDLSFFKGFLHEQPHLYTEKLEHSFGPARQEGEELLDRHFEIASALQKISEDIATHLLKKLHRLTGEKNLVLSGGFFMNSVFNGKVLELTPFEKVYVSSCPDDSGNCLGAAYYLYNNILGNRRGPAMIHNYFGPEYSDDDIRRALAENGLTSSYEKDIFSRAAKLITEGKIIGWFQGKMEFGQRALGNRSILADPRRPEMKDMINRAVKFREAFRPFAPAVLQERQADYFDTRYVGDVPFMEMVYAVRPDKRGEIPAVVHVDGTGRLQTVSRLTNERFHRLISEFEKVTGTPVLLNTSFNLNGEPIVCTPRDAIRTFYSCGMDALIMGNHSIAKGAG